MAYTLSNIDFSRNSIVCTLNRSSFNEKRKLSFLSVFRLDKKLKIHKSVEKSSKMIYNIKGGLKNQKNRGQGASL